MLLCHIDWRLLLVQTAALLDIDIYFQNERHFSLIVNQPKFLWVRHCYSRDTHDFCVILWTRIRRIKRRNDVTTIRVVELESKNRKDFSPPSSIHLPLPSSSPSPLLPLRGQRCDLFSVFFLVLLFFLFSTWYITLHPFPSFLRC